MKPRKVLVVADMPVGEGWSFLRPLRDAGWEVNTLWTDVRTRTLSYPGARLLHAWPSYVGLGLRALRASRRYDAVLCWQGIVGLVMGALRGVISGGGTPIVAMGVIRSGGKPGLAAGLRDRVYHMGLRGLDRILCYSTAEVASYASRFGVPPERLAFVPVGLDTSWLDWSTHRPTVDIPRCPYLFSGGRSNRDFETLLAAVEGLPLQVVVVKSGSQTIARTPPANTSVLVDCYDADFFHLMNDSEMVVIPLGNPAMSAGQLVLLQAMALSKPVIVTAGAGVADYVAPGKTAILVPPHDPRSLREAIVALHGDPAERERLGKNGNELFRQRHTLEQMGKRVAEAIADL